MKEKLKELLNMELWMFLLMSVVTTYLKKLETGCAMVTNDEEIPCKYVIHTVGPKCKKNQEDYSGQSDLLAKYVNNSLKWMIKNIVNYFSFLKFQLESIAFISRSVVEFSKEVLRNLLMKIKNQWKEEKLFSAILVKKLLKLWRIVIYYLYVLVVLKIKQKLNQSDFENTKIENEHTSKKTMKNKNYKEELEKYSEEKMKKWQEKY